MGQTDTFEIFKDAKAQYRWRLKASNHEVVATSEGYESKQGAVNSVLKMPEWCSNTPIKDLTL